MMAGFSAVAVVGSFTYGSGEVAKSGVGARSPHGPLKDPHHDTVLDPLL